MLVMWSGRAVCKGHVGKPYRVESTAKYNIAAGIKQRLEYGVSQWGARARAGMRITNWLSVLGTR